MMMSKFFLFASLLSSISALPLHSLVARDVWVPKITCPDASTVWSVGGTYTVTWDTSSKPAQVTNSQGKVFLRINDRTQSTALVEGFPLTDGHVDVTIPPNTNPANDWVLVLFGDSGNWSPPFTISAPPS